MKSILFNTEMVRAILEGRKTQTRRVVKSKKAFNVHFFEGKPYQIVQADDEGYDTDITIKPKYQIGDILYVRETFKLGAWREDGRFAVDYKASPEIKNTPWVTFENDYNGEKSNNLIVNTTNELESLGYPQDKNGFYHWEAGKSPLKWKPSVHMPKEASRIFLEVTNVRLEHLQDISEKEAIKEGFEPLPIISAKDRFLATMNSIYGSDVMKYNPFVWVYEFKQIEKP